MKKIGWIVPVIFDVFTFFSMQPIVTFMMTLIYDVKVIPVIFIL